MLDPLQHSPLIVCVLNLLHLDHLSLFQHFDCIKSAIMFALDQMHTAEAACPKGPLDLEVLQGIFASGFARDLVCGWLLDCSGALWQAMLGGSWGV